MLSESQILLLNNLIYRDEFSNSDDYSNNKGKTIGEILENVENNKKQQSMTVEEWNAIFEMAKTDPDILNLRVIDMCHEAETGAKMACFADESGQAYAVFAGTGANEWRDDCVAGTMTDSPQQIKALQWFETLPSEYDNIIVSGHSKGGNKAMYVAVVSGKAGECYAFDGEGFSAEFCEKYADKIEEKKNQIHLRANYKDFVNVLLYQIAGDIKFVVNDEGIANAGEYHCPNALFKYENGEITYSIGEFGNQDPSMEMLGEFSRYLLKNATESEKILALSVLGELLTQVLGGKKAVVRDDIMEMFGAEAVEIILSYLTKYLRELWVSDSSTYYKYQDSFSNFASNAVGNIWYLLLGAILNDAPVEELFELLTSGTVLRIYRTIQGLVGDDVRGRDFSETTKAIMLEAAKEMEDEEWWQVTRWDCWYKIENFFGQLQWDKYAGKVDEYYRKLIDVNDSSVKEIERIFEQVYEIDVNSSSKMESFTAVLTSGVFNVLCDVRNRIIPHVPQIQSYGTGANKGNITYVNQNSKYAGLNGWGAYSNKSNGECGYACQIMALSYLGINISPEELCRREYANNEIHTYWDSAASYGYDVRVDTGDSSLSNYQNIRNMVNEYKRDSGQGKQSPVAIHYHCGTEQHTLLLIDYDESTQEFTALDPWSNDNNPATRKIRIEQNGRISQGDGAAHTSSGNAYIDGYLQYESKTV